MKKNKRLQKVFAILMCFLLTAESVCFMTQGDTEASDGAEKLQSGQAASWAASIPDLLAAGEYEEGVVIAGIDMSKAASFDNPGSALEEKEFRDHAGALMTVNAEAAFSVFKESLSLESGEDICITSIERKDMSTEQMLSMLAGDESVVFAEPNYCVSVEPAEGTDEEMLQGEMLNHLLTVGIGNPEVDKEKKEEDLLPDSIEMDPDGTEMDPNSSEMEESDDAAADPGKDEMAADSSYDADAADSLSYDAEEDIEDPAMNPSDSPSEEWEAELLPDTYEDTVQEGTTATELALYEIAGAEDVPSDDLDEIEIVGTEDIPSDDWYEEADIENGSYAAEAAADSEICSDGEMEPAVEAGTAEEVEAAEEAEAAEEVENAEEVEASEEIGAFEEVETAEEEISIGTEFYSDDESSTEEGADALPQPDHVETGEEITEEDTVFPFEAGQARDASALQWAMSENASFRAAGSFGSGSIHVPGWPDGSNMDHKIIVAVMDQAVDFSNPDLADRAYPFSADLMETLGCDRYGYNALPKSFPAEEQGGRGTPAAGIIGASWDGRGISGVASNVEIVSVQNIDPEGRCSLANTLRGMNFIKEARMSGVEIRIVNNSWVLRQSSKALSAAVTELGRLGIINVFCAGDESRDLNSCTSAAGSLADNPYAVIAASTDPSGNLADSSSYGNEIVTLGAPGVSILSTIQTPSSGYIPAIASQNKYYEDFESGELSLRIFQVDYETGEEIAGTEGAVVSGEDVPGFEGRCVYKVKTDPSGLGSRDDGTVLLEMDLGDVSDLISGGDYLGFAYGGSSAPSIEGLVDTASGDAPFVPLNESGKANCMNTFAYSLPEGVDTDHLSFRLAVRPGSDHEICFDAIGIGGEAQPYKFLSGSSMAAPAVSGAAAVLASRYYEELQALDDASSAEVLASLVRASVRPLSSLAETTITGGTLDLSAEPSIPEIRNHLSSDLQYTLAGDSETLEERAQNGIPLVVIRIDEQELHQSKKGNWYGTIADMNNSPDHSVRCNGSVEILLPEEGYVSEYGGSAPSGSIPLDYIRGRGNSTWVSMQKKPYKLQLQDKSDLFGMGQSKSWALMANATDPSLIKNRITSYLGDAMGFSWSPQMIPVDVVMIGSESGRDYLGNYFLSELVGIEDSRLDIDELNKNVASMEGDPNITGGHLLSVFNLYQDSDQPESNYFTLNSGISFTHEDPSFENEDQLTDGQIAQREYIRSYMQQVDSLIMEGDTIDEEAHNELASLLDLTSVADYWLIQEFSSNVDSFGTSSTFLNKERNGKLKMGPIWDFDLAWGDPSTAIWYEYTTIGFNTTKAFWLDELRLKDPLFVDLLKQEWPRLRSHLEELISEGGVIDQFQQELSRSRQANIERWPDLAKLDDYGTLISNLKQWISMRIAWFDEHLEEISKSLVKISYEADGNLIESMYVRNGTYLSKGPDDPYKEGYVFIGWFEKNTHKGVKNYLAEEDTVFVAEYLTEEEAVAPEALYFSDYEVWVLLGDTFDADFQSCVFPENASSKAIKWSSSNTEVLSVESDGSMKGNSIGEAVLTGTLYNGISNSLTVHVYNRSDNMIMPDGLKLVPEDMELTLGETKELRVISTPEGILRRHMFLSLTLEDPSVAELKRGAGNDRVFLLTGLKEGKTKLTIEAERDESKYTAVCNVRVVNDRTSPGEEDPRKDPEKEPETTPEKVPETTPERDSEINPGTDPTAVPVVAEDGNAFEKGADAAALDKAIAETAFESDPEGSEYSLLRLRTKKETRSSIKVIWQKADGAKKYVVYAGVCGKKNALKKVKTTTSRSYTLKKWNGKKLQKGKYYKFMVAALDENNKVISVSKLVHAATKGGKAGNVKSVSTTSKADRKVKKLTLKAGKTFKLKAKATAESKEQKISAHRSIQFESSNPGIAAVSKKGQIRAVSRGVCYVYAYAQNGRYSRVKVSVIGK